MIRWENFTSHRYYQVALQHNLFGELELIRIWGGIGNARGRQWIAPVAPHAADAALAKIATERTRHGYRLVATTDE